MAEQISFLSNLPLEQAVMRLQSLHQSGNIRHWFFDIGRTDVKITQNPDGSVRFHLARRIRYSWGIAAIKGKLLQSHQEATQVEATCPLLTTSLQVILLLSILLFILLLVSADFPILIGILFLIFIVPIMIFWGVRVKMARNYLMKQLRQALE